MHRYRVMPKDLRVTLLTPEEKGKARADIIMGEICRYFQASQNYREMVEKIEESINNLPLNKR